MKIKTLIYCCCFFTSIHLFSQGNVAINENGASPDASAILDVQASDKGFLMPRLSSSQREAIQNPAEGLLVFDTSTKSFWLSINNTWQELVPKNELTNAHNFLVNFLPPFENGAAIPNHFENFGVRIALGEEFAAVGLPEFDNQTGAVFVYQRKGTGWTFMEQLTHPNLTSDDEFGNSVAISGNRILVGAWQYDDNCTNEGAVFAFEYDGNSWQFEQLLQLTSCSNGRLFGMSMAAYENKTIICDVGKAYYFEHNGNGWVERWDFSSSVTGIPVLDMNDKYLIIGSEDDDPMVAFFKFVSQFNEWEEVGIVEPSGILDNNSGFGKSLALYENKLIVGAPDKTVDGNDFVGSAYLFELNSQQDEWEQIIEIQPENPTELMRFGSAVGIYQHFLAISAPRYQPTQFTNRGVVYIYSQIGDGNFDIIKSIGSNQLNPHPMNKFGSSLRFLGFDCMIGSPMESGLQSDVGRIYIGDVRF